MKRAPSFVAAALATALLALAGDSSPAVAGSDLVVTQDRELPWNDVVMVVILLLAFSGGTIAIINSTRRR